VRELLGRVPVVWLDVRGLGDPALLREAAEVFGLHRLVIADVANTTQHPKVERYPERLFLVARQVAIAGGVLESEQLSVVVGPGFVLTFQERPGDCFDPVRERIRAGTGQVRGAGPDYLAHALLDAVVDSYFPLLEELGERMERLEEEILEASEPRQVLTIRDLKRDLLLLRRIVWPQREAMHQLVREPGPLIQPETLPYLADVYDHLVRLLEILESFRELGTGLMEVYLSMVSQRMNEVMKVLTVIATIFIPLTFIAGIYGMNFAHMPELGWRWGYFACLGVMAVTALGFLAWFRRRGWL
jgi:magnesium transporter